MTVSTTILNEVVKSGDGSGDTFNFPFSVAKDSDLFVYKYDSNLKPTILVLDTDYTVSGFSSENTGVIKYPKTGSTRLGADEYIVITTKIQIRQSLQLKNNQKINYENLEKLLDNVVRMINQNAVNSNKSIKVHETKDFDAPKIVEKLKEGQTYSADNQGNLKAVDFENNVKKAEEHSTKSETHSGKSEDSATKAKESELKAEQWAEKTDGEVESGKYSAKYYANEAQKLANALNGRFTVSATQPTSPNANDVWYDTTNSKTFLYTGSAWVSGVDEINTALANAKTNFNTNATTKTTNFNTNASTKKSEITSEGDKQVGRITTEGGVQFNRIKTLGDKYTGLISGKDVEPLALGAGYKKLDIYSFNGQISVALKDGTLSTDNNTAISEWENATNFALFTNEILENAYTYNSVSLLLADGTTNNVPLGQLGTSGSYVFLKVAKTIGTFTFTSSASSYTKGNFYFYNNEYKKALSNGSNGINDWNNLEKLVYATQEELGKINGWLALNEPLDPSTFTESLKEKFVKELEVLPRDEYETERDYYTSNDVVYGKSLPPSAIVCGSIVKKSDYEELFTGQGVYYNGSINRTAQTKDISSVSLTGANPFTEHAHKSEDHEYDLTNIIKKEIDCVADIGALRLRFNDKANNKLTNWGTWGVFIKQDNGKYLYSRPLTEEYTKDESGRLSNWYTFWKGQDVAFVPLGVRPTTISSGDSYTKGEVYTYGGKHKVAVASGTFANADFAKATKFADLDLVISQFAFYPIDVADGYFRVPLEESISGLTAYRFPKKTPLSNFKDGNIPLTKELLKELGTKYAIGDTVHHNDMGWKINGHYSMIEVGAFGGLKVDLPKQTLRMTANKIVGLIDVSNPDYSSARVDHSSGVAKLYEIKFIQPDGTKATVSMDYNLIPNHNNSIVNVFIDDFIWANFKIYITWSGFTGKKIGAVSFNSGYDPDGNAGVYRPKGVEIWKVKSDNTEVRLLGGMVKLPAKDLSGNAYMGSNVYKKAFSQEQITADEVLTNKIMVKTIKQDSAPVDFVDLSNFNITLVEPTKNVEFYVFPSGAERYVYVGDVDVSNSLTIEGFDRLPLGTQGTKQDNSTKLDIGLSGTPCVITNCVKERFTDNLESDVSYKTFKTKPSAKTFKIKLGGTVAHNPNRLTYAEHTFSIKAIGGGTVEPTIELKKKNGKTTYVAEKFGLKEWRITVKVAGDSFVDTKLDNIIEFKTTGDSKFTVSKVNEENYTTTAFDMDLSKIKPIFREIGLLDSAKHLKGDLIEKHIKKPYHDNGVIISDRKNPFSSLAVSDGLIYFNDEKGDIYSPRESNKYTGFVVGVKYSKYTNLSGYYKGYPDGNGNTDEVLVNHIWKFNGFTATVNKITYGANNWTRPFDDRDGTGTGWWVSKDSSNPSVIEFTLSKPVAIFGISHSDQLAGTGAKAKLQYKNVSNQWVDVVGYAGKDVDNKNDNFGTTATQYRVVAYGTGNTDNIVIGTLRFLIKTSADNPTNPFPNDDGSTGKVETGLVEYEKKISLTQFRKSSSSNQIAITTGVAVYLDGDDTKKYDGDRMFVDMTNANTLPHTAEWQVKAYTPENYSLLLAHEKALAGLGGKVDELFYFKEGKTSGTYNLPAGKKFSDYDLLVGIARGTWSGVGKHYGWGNGIMTSKVFKFTSNAERGFHIGTEASFVDIRYSSDTSFRIAETYNNLSLMQVVGVKL